MRRQIEEARVEEERRRLEFEKQMETGRCEEEAKRIAFEKMMISMLNERCGPSKV